MVRTGIGGMFMQEYAVERIPLKVGLNIFNKAYLETKQKRMSHLYDNSDF